MAMPMFAVLCYCAVLLIVVIIAFVVECGVHTAGNLSMRCLRMSMECTYVWFSWNCL